MVKEKENQGNVFIFLILIIFYVSNKDSIEK